MSLSQVHIREGKTNFTYCSECNGDPQEDYDKPGPDMYPRVADRKEAKTTDISKFPGQQQVWVGEHSLEGPHIYCRAHHPVQTEGWLRTGFQAHVLSATELLKAPQ